MSQPEPQQSLEFYNCRLNALKQMKKSNHLLSQDTLNKLISKTDKEKIIMDLKVELQYLQALQSNYQSNLDVINSTGKETEKNHSEISIYCACLRDELKEFVHQIDLYEDKIFSLKEESDQLKRGNESITSQKQSEQIQLEAEYKKICNKINEEAFKLKCIKEEYHVHKSRRIGEKQKLIEKEAKDVEKYLSLFKQYKSMTNKYNVYEQDDEASNFVELKTQRKIYKENIEKEELIMYDMLILIII